jgi:hypothetical protein
MNSRIQEAGSEWLSTNERVVLQHSVLIVQFQPSEVSPGAKLAQVLALITQPFFKSRAAIALSDEPSPCR